MENICNYLKNNGRVVAVHQPVGFNQGYAAYLDYSSRKKYWDEYEHTLWEGSDYVKGLFKNDESKFHDDFCKRLKECHDKLLSPKANAASAKITANKKGASHINKYNISNNTKDKRNHSSNMFNIFSTSDTTKLVSSTNDKQNNLSNVFFSTLFGAIKDAYSPQGKENKQTFKTASKSR